MNLRLFSIPAYLTLVISVLIFATGSLFFENYIEDMKQDKSLYPILVYTNSVTEAEDIINFAKENPIYLDHSITDPDYLESMLISKYNLADYKSISGDYKLPFQIEISISPLPMNQIIIFVSQLSARFTDSIIHYNAKLWNDVEMVVERNMRIFLCMQVIFLSFYVFIQLFIRLSFINKYHENFFALANSGIAHKKLLKKEVSLNFKFIMIALCSITLLNVIINYFDLVSYVGRVWTTHFYYINPKMILMFFFANLIVIIFQKSLFKKLV